MVDVPRVEDGKFAPGVTGNPNGRAGNKRGFDPRTYVRNYLQAAILPEDQNKKKKDGSNGRKTVAEKQRARQLVELMITELIAYSRVSCDSTKILEVLKYVTPTDREEKIKESAYKEFSDMLFPVILKYIPQDKVEAFSKDLLDLMDRMNDSNDN